VDFVARVVGAGLLNRQGYVSVYNAVNNPWVWKSTGCETPIENQQGAANAERHRNCSSSFTTVSTPATWEALLATMHGDVMWANGMAGRGMVYRHDGVRNYWDPAMGDD